MSKLSENQNIVLIGMPGSGKSTIGVLLAKYSSRDFIDTDVCIQAGEGKRLYEIITERGMKGFCEIEEKYILSLNCKGYVIATGGSVVYSRKAMEHLKSSGVIVHLDLSIPELEKRLSDLDERGVVRAPGQTLEDLFREREPLYHRYADITVNCSGLTHEEVVERIISDLRFN
jgi:shikimate kinase